MSDTQEPQAMDHDPNDPFCTCEDCMKATQAVHDEVIKSMKPPSINRMDPAWAMFAAAYLTQPWHPDMGWGPGLTPQDCADFADAMLRERDRRDREER